MCQVGLVDGAGGVVHIADVVVAGHVGARAVRDRDRHARGGDGLVARACVLVGEHLRARRVDHVACCCTGQRAQCACAGGHCHAVIGLAHLCGGHRQCGFADAAHALHRAHSDGVVVFVCALQAQVAKRHRIVRDHVFGAVAAAASSGADRITRLYLCGVQGHTGRRLRAVVHLAHRIGRGRDGQAAHRQSPAVDLITAELAAVVGAQIGHAPVVIARVQPASARQIAAGVHAGVKRHRGVGVVCSTPAVAAACAHAQVEDIGAIAIAGRQAILGGDPGGLPCIARAAVAVGVCLPGDGDQQLVGRDHLQVALLHRDGVVAVLGCGREAKVIDCAVAAHQGRRGGTGVGAVAGHGHLHQGTGGRIVPLPAIVAHTGVNGGVGKLGDKGFGIAHLDRQSHWGDGAHVATGRGGQAVVAQQRACVGAQVRGQQRCTHRARAAVGVHVGAGIGAGRLRDAGTFACDETAQAEVASRQGGVGRAVVSLAHAAHQVSGQRLGQHLQRGAAGRRVRTEGRVIGSVRCDGVVVGVDVAVSACGRRQRSRQVVIDDLGGPNLESGSVARSGQHRIGIRQPERIDHGLVARIDIAVAHLQLSLAQTLGVDGHPLTEHDLAVGTTIDHRAAGIGGVGTGIDRAACVARQVQGGKTVVQVGQQAGVVRVTGVHIGIARGARLGHAVAGKGLDLTARAVVCVQG